MFKHVQNQHGIVQNVCKYKYSQERGRERKRETQPWRHITLEEPDARVSVNFSQKTAREEM